MENFKRILIIRTDRLGDVILSTAAVRNLRLSYPDAYIAFLCRPYTKDAVIGNPDLNEVIVYDKYGKQKSLGATIKFAWGLRRKKFDLAVVLHPTNRAHLIAFLAKIPKRVGWDRNLSWLLTKKIKHLKQEGKKHELEYSLDILKAIGLEVSSKDTYFPIPNEAVKRVEELLKQNGVSRNDQLIVIGPSASCPSKRWPRDNFLKLIKLLKEKASSKFVAITSEAERQIAEEMVKDNQVIDFRGKLNISELGALFKRSALFISNDSGPVHIAASIGTPVISIFGRSDPGLSPQRWRPLGKNSTYIHKDVDCPVCLAHNCRKGFLCLEAVTPEEVAEKARLMLISRKNI